MSGLISIYIHIDLKSEPGFAFDFENATDYILGSPARDVALRFLSAWQPHARHQQLDGRTYGSSHPEPHAQECEICRGNWGRRYSDSSHLPQVSRLSVTLAGPISDWTKRSEPVQPEFHPNGRRNHNYVPPENAAKKPAEAPDEICQLHLKQWINQGQRAKLEAEYNAGIASGKSWREIGAALGQIVKGWERGR
jgi:hypothetical protein